MSALGREHTSQALPPQSLYAGAKRLPRRRLGANFGAFVLKFAVGLRILALNRQMTRYPADNRHRIRRPIAGMHGERVPSVEIGRRLLWRFRLVPPEPSRARRTRGSRWLRWPSTKLAIKAGPQRNVAKAAVARIAKKMFGIRSCVVSAFGQVGTL